MAGAAASAAIAQEIESTDMYHWHPQCSAVTVVSMQFLGCNYSLREYCYGSLHNVDTISKPQIANLEDQNSMTRSKLETYT